MGWKLVRTASWKEKKVKDPNNTGYQEYDFKNITSDEAWSDQIKSLLQGVINKQLNITRKYHLAGRRKEKHRHTVKDVIVRTIKRKDKGQWFKRKIKQKIVVILTFETGFHQVSEYGKHSRWGVGWMHYILKFYEQK